MKTRIDISTLTLEERLDLLEQIWDSLAVDPDDALIPSTTRLELDRDGRELIPLDQALRLIANQRR